MAFSSKGGQDGGLSLLQPPLLKNPLFPKRPDERFGDLGSLDGDADPFPGIDPENEADGRVGRPEKSGLDRDVGPGIAGGAVGRPDHVQVGFKNGGTIGRPGRVATT